MQYFRNVNKSVQLVRFLLSKDNPTLIILQLLWFQFYVINEDILASVNVRTYCLHDEKGTKLLEEKDKVIQV